MGRLRLEEARKLLDIERRLHREEVEAIMSDIHATSKVTSASRGCGSEDAGAAREQELGRRELLRSCNELWRPASAFLLASSRPALPQVPASIDELGDWLELLSSRLNTDDEA